MLRKLALALLSFVASSLALEAGVRLSNMQLADWLNANRRIQLFVEWDAAGRDLQTRLQNALGSEYVVGCFTGDRPSIDRTNRTDDA